ncbi:MAG: peptide chain release factor N(5)-glutamine methyltransferase [Spirochaetaceae bacterium]|nr:MAG: peptide chain release factor N(5)-glutamine methyltransferase [Spirochaetaceae bacterium]
MQSPTVSSLLQDGSTKLKNAGSETPLLDCRILLAHSLGVSTDALYSMYRDAVSERAEETYHRLVHERSQGTPVAYLTGSIEFYGRSFLVDSRVLVPRPETEFLVDTALEKEADLPSGTILDTCTGSGCVAVSLKAELPDRSIIASDISEDALVVARKNARRLVHDDILFVQADAVPVSTGPYAMITANPPYVPTEQCPRRRGSASCNQSPAWEPILALDGGQDGLDIVTRIATAAFDTLVPDGWFITEVGYDQSLCVRDLLARIGYTDVSCKKDLAGIDRIICGRKTSRQSA